MQDKKKFETPINECKHEYKNIDFYEDDPRAEYADRFGICPECGADVTYRIHYEPNGSTRVELYSVYND